MRRWMPVLFVSAIAAGSLFIFWSANAMLAPQVAQTPELLLRAHAMQRLAPFATLVLAAAGALVTLRAWKERNDRVYRLVSVVPILGLIAIAVAAQRPVAERMFAPMAEARFVAAGEASFLEPRALVLGIAVGNAAKAYPVSIMAYHHLVNDELAGEPFVVTY